MNVDERNVIEQFVNLTSLAVQHGLPIQLLTRTNSVFLWVKYANSLREGLQRKIF